jgi:hypothetical protein
VPLSFAALMLGVMAVAFKIHEHRQDSTNTLEDVDKNSGLLDKISNAVIGGERSADDLPPSADMAKVNLELQRAAFAMEIAQAKQAVRHLESANAEWTALLNTTLSDAIGKRIAGNEELLLRFMALRQMPSPIEPEPIAQDIIALLNDVQREVDRSTQTESTLKDERATIAEGTKFVLISLAFNQARLDELNQIREAAASSPASEFELHAAISVRAASLANKLNAAAAEAARELEATMDSELKTLTQERDASNKLVMNLEKQLAQIAKGEQLETRVEDDGVQPVPSRDDYNRELEKIRTDLVAFTTPGYVQPESADKLVYRKTKEPFSYSALKRIGALDDSEKGRAILLRVGGSKSATQQNDRPLGSFPRMHSLSELRKPNVVARLSEAQRLLRQYGSLMVEDGLLSP